MHALTPHLEGCLQQHLSAGQAAVERGAHLVAHQAHELTLGLQAHAAEAQRGKKQQNVSAW